jgi:hypothetical protein
VKKLKLGFVYVVLLFATLVTSPLYSNPSTGLSYVVDGTGLINVTIDKSQIPAGAITSADVASLKLVNQLKTNQINYERRLASASLNED